MNFTRTLVKTIKVPYHMIIKKNKLSTNFTRNTYKKIDFESLNAAGFISCAGFGSIVGLCAGLSGPPPKDILEVIFHIVSISSCTSVGCLIGAIIGSVSLLWMPFVIISTPIAFYRNYRYVRDKK